MTQLLRTVSKVKRYINPDLAIDGILLTIVDNRTNLAKSTVEALRQNFFENGGSFKLLKTLKGELYSIKKIRNAIAHTSKKAKQDFENLVRGKVGHLPTDISPVKFVSEYKKGVNKDSPIDNSCIRSIILIIQWF